MGKRVDILNAIGIIIVRELFDGDEDNQVFCIPEMEL